jgi:outer membrane protein TolC
MHYRFWPPARVTGILIATLGMTGLCGCTVGPDFHAPAAPDTDHYVAGEPITTVGAPGAGAVSQTLVTDQDIPAQWWSLFHSAPLDALVRTALHDSPTIVAAAAALRSAQEGYVAQRGSSVYPQIDGQFWRHKRTTSAGSSRRHA